MVIKIFETGSSIPFIETSGLSPKEPEIHLTIGDSKILITQTRKKNSIRIDNREYIREESWETASNISSIVFDAKLKVFTNSRLKIIELTNLLSSINELYAILENLKKDEDITSLAQKTKLAESYFLPYDQLILSSCYSNSPAVWEFLGSLNPLLQIREYLNERHERKKDKRWREEQEARKYKLENDEIALRVFKQQIELLKSLEYPEQEIKIMIERKLEKSLGLLVESDDKITNT